MSYEELTFERHGKVALATLNRPKKLNALNGRLQQETLAVCAEVENDDSIRALVVTGEGRGFCAGADLTGGRRPQQGEERRTAPQTQRLEQFGWVGRQALAFYNLTKPSVAAVNGVAAGAGMSLALACDMRVGTENARFKTVFIERSLSPDSGMSFFLPRIVGYSRAADLIFTSRDVGADEAYRIGLLDRVVGTDELVEKSIELADSIALWPPMAIRSAKRVLQENMNCGLEQALKNEYRALDYARRAPNDVREARMSFVERRAPEFTGE